MALVQKCAQQIGEVEAIKANLIALVAEVNKNVSPICGTDSNKWSSYESNFSIKRGLFDYFSLQTFSSDNSLSKIKIESVAGDTFKHPMLCFVCLFLIFFTIFFLLSFFLYFKCGRRMFCCITCGLCLNKNKTIGVAEKKESSCKNDIDNSEELKKFDDIENRDGSVNNNISQENDSKVDNIVNETEQNQDVIADEEKIEEVKRNKSINNKMKRNKLITLLLGLFLLMALSMLTIFAKNSSSDSDHFNTVGFCKTFYTIENTLIGSCPATVNIENAQIDTCFTVTDTINDGILILKDLESVIKELDKQNLLTTEHQIPFLQEIEIQNEKLEKLSNNLDVNTTYMLNTYKHSLILAEKGKTMVDNVIRNIKNKKKEITNAANKSKEGIIEVSNHVYKILDETVAHILENINTFLKKAREIISDPENIKKVRSTINDRINIVNTLFIIFVVCLVIIIVLICVCIFYFIKGNEKTYKNLVIKMVGIFSVYFGIITFPIMILTLLFTIVSILGSTMCTISEKPEVLNKLIPEQKRNNIPILGTCLANENALIVDGSYINEITQKLEGFGTDNVLKEMNHFAEIQKDIVSSFEQKYNEIADILWIAQFDKTKIQDLLNKITNENVKSALLLTHIYKKDVANTPTLDGQNIVTSVDEFLRIANPLLLNSGYELCYEDVQCDSDSNKYNITNTSSVNDQKYKNFKNKAKSTTNGAEQSLDAVLEILTLKAKLLHDRIFNISDLSPQHTEKLLINEYIGPFNSSGENNSYIHVWLTELLLGMKSSIHFVEFKNTVSHLVTIKNNAMFQVKKQTKKLNCQVAAKGAKTLRNYICYNVMVSIMHLTILCFVMGILTFLLWLYFLCLWLNYKMEQEREILESEREN